MALRSLRRHGQGQEHTGGDDREPRLITGRAPIKSAAAARLETPSALRCRTPARRGRLPAVVRLVEHAAVPGHVRDVENIEGLCDERQLGLLRHANRSCDAHVLRDEAVAIREVLGQGDWRHDLVEGRTRPHDRHRAAGVDNPPCSVFDFGVVVVDEAPQLRSAQALSQAVVRGARKERQADAVTIEIEAGQQGIQGRRAVDLGVECHSPRIAERTPETARAVVVGQRPDAAQRQAMAAVIRDVAVGQAVVVIAREPAIDEAGVPRKGITELELPAGGVAFLERQVQALIAKVRAAPEDIDRASRAVVIGIERPRRFNGAQRDDRIPDERDDASRGIYAGDAGTIEAVPVDAVDALQRSDVHVAPHHVVGRQRPPGPELALYAGVGLNAVRRRGLRIDDLISLLDDVDAAPGQIGAVTESRRQVGAQCGQDGEQVAARECRGRAAEIEPGHRAVNRHSSIS